MRTVVGVNEFVDGSDGLEIETLRIDSGAEARQRERLARLRAERDDERVRAALDSLKAAAAGGANTVPHILECARSYCTLYEIRAAMEEVFGAYREPVFF